MLLTHKYREGIFYRLGIKAYKLPYDQNRIWIHTVSVGELNAAKQLIQELLARYPTHGFVISTTTQTGQDLAKKNYSGHPRVSIIYFPLDFPWAVKKYLKNIHPQLVIITETEIWPNFLKCAHHLNIPVTLVNGRISPKAYKRYSKVKIGLKKILPLFIKILMQSEDDKKRIVSMGAPDHLIQVSGNIKFDYSPSQPVDSAQKEWRTKLFLSESDTVILAGSTHRGEEALILKVFKELVQNFKELSLTLILAPRHPERFSQVNHLLQTSSFKDHYQPVSALLSLKKTKTASRLILVDTLGILSSLYSLADIVIMGGSFSPYGGHNILEAAAYGKPIVCGPHMENFQEILNLFDENRAILSLSSSENLEVKLNELLRNQKMKKTLGVNALSTLREHRGATSRTVEVIENLLSH